MQWVEAIGAQQYKLSVVGGGVQFKIEIGLGVAEKK